LLKPELKGVAAVIRCGVLGVVVALVSAGLGGGTVKAVADEARLTPSSAPGPARAVRSDFNGDGYGDLVVGAPVDVVLISDPPEDGDELAVMATVHVIYGSSAGLTARANQYWTAESFGGAGSYQFGESLATGDFDGDGYSDLAVGAPDADAHSVVEAGAVRILYGSREGLTAARTQLWGQDSPGIAGEAEGSDGFGWSLAAANLGNGPEDDLAIGVVGVGRGGAVSVIYGSPSGLTAKGNQLWTQDSAGIAGRAEREDAFGHSLAAGNFDGRSTADLAIGNPYEDVGRKEDAGAVNVIYGSSRGLTATGNQIWTQDSPRIRGTAKTDDSFGQSLAAGPFAGRQYDDLAIGVPVQVTGGEDGGGDVNVIYGSARGLTAAGNQIWSQASRGIAGRPESGDMFGTSLAAANFGHDTGGRPYADLAIGVQWEKIGDRCCAGLVHVIYGGSDGLAARNSQIFHQGTPGIIGRLGEGDAVGSSLASTNFGNGRYADLAVGAPGNDLASADGLSFQGAVNVIYGSPQGLAAAGDQLWSARQLEHPGILETGFGSSLAAGRAGSRTQTFR
jgi:hypothetical protein